MISMTKAYVPASKRGFILLHNNNNDKAQYPISLLQDSLKFNLSKPLHQLDEEKHVWIRTKCEGQGRENIEDK